MKPRSTLRGLMAFVAFFAVGMTALRSNDPLWAAVVLALTVATLCISTLIAIYSRGAWAGFAVFGWAVFLICQPHSAPTVGPTSLPIAMAYRVVFFVSAPQKFPWVTFQIPGGYPAIMADGEGEAMLSAVRGGNATFRGMVPVNSLRAGLCLLSLAAGIVGAVAGSFIDRRTVARAGSE